MKIDEDKIFEQLSERLKDYKQEPDKRLWTNIEKQISKPKMSAIKVLTIAGGLILVGVVCAVAFAPMKAAKQEPKMVAKNIKTPKIAADRVESTAVVQDKEILTDISEKTAEKTIVKTQSCPATITDIDKVSEKKTENSTSQISNTPAVVKVEPQIPTKKDTQKPKTTTNNSVTQVENKVSKGGGNPSEMEETNELVVMPNAFQPNSNDEKLNTFKPMYHKELRSFEMQIYARNGMKVFNSKDVNYGWNGEIKGKTADKGTYVYYIQYEDMNGKVYQKKGTLWLHR